MKRSLSDAIILVLILTVAATTPTWAQSHSSSRVRIGAVVFRLRVVGQPAAGTQFWVAYGPVAGRFGIVRLQSTGAGKYAASRTLPLFEPTSVAYIAAQGEVRTRAGLEPAHVLAIISTSGPVPLSEVQRHVPRWQAPVG